MHADETVQYTVPRAELTCNVSHHYGVDHRQRAQQRVRHGMLGKELVSRRPGEGRRHHQAMDALKSCYKVLVAHRLRRGRTDWSNTAFRVFMKTIGSKAEL